MQRYRPVIQQVAVLMAITFCQAAFGEVSQRSLRRLTEDLIEQNDVTFTPPMLHWDNDPLTYCLGDATCNGPVLWHIPLHAQFRVTLIRRYRTTPSQRRFWGPVLRNVESEIDAMLKLLQRGSRDEKGLVEELSKREQAIRDLYQRELSKLAKQYGKHGKQGAQEACPARCILYHVTFKCRPSGAKIYLVHAGDKKVYDCLVENEMPTDGWEPQKIWIDIGQSIGLYGNFYLRADWENGQFADDRIRVTKARTIVVSPD